MTILKVITATYTAHFKPLAIAHGLVEHNNEAEICFAEALPVSTPNQLRSLFVQLTLQEFTTVPVFANEEFLQAMMIDFWINNGHNAELARNQWLKALQTRFIAEDKTLSTFGLPEPEDMDSLLARERLRYDTDIEKAKFNEMVTAFPFNELQSQAFENVINSYHHNPNRGIFLLQGKAGSGKSTFAKAVVHYCRAHSSIVLGCASTALAASVYNGMNFDTGHELFNIPIVENQEELDQAFDLQCKFMENHEKFALITAAKVFIWDEIGSQHVRDFLQYTPP